MGWRMAFFLSKRTLRDTSCIAVLRVEIVNWVPAISRPLDCMKVRISLSPTPITMKNALQNTYESGGVLAFYRGVRPCIAGVIPYSGVDLAIYETLKSIYTNFQIQKAKSVEEAELPCSNGPPSMSMMVPLACGALSSTIAQVCSYPLALIRTRLQAQGLQNAEAYNGAVDVFRKTIAREGLKGLYKGMFPNLLKVVPAMSISYLVYEKVKSVLFVKM